MLARRNVSHEHKEDTILISVKDVGPGIPPEEVPLLLDSLCVSNEIFQDRQEEQGLAST